MEVIFCIKLLIHHKTFKVKYRVVVRSIPWLRPFWKINIPFLFRPFALEVLDYITVLCTVVNAL